MLYEQIAIWKIRFLRPSDVTNDLSREIIFDPEINNISLTFDFNLRMRTRTLRSLKVWKSWQKINNCQSCGIFRRRITEQRVKSVRWLSAPWQTMLISTSWLWAMHQTMSSASSRKSLEGRVISGECDLAISRPCYLNMKKQRFVCRVAHVHVHVRGASICRPSVQTANCGLLISRRAACLALIERLNEFQTVPECRTDTSARH